MSQHDFNIANQGFPATRADINNAFQAIASNSSGPTAPSTTYANMWWYDETNNKMYLRNEADSAWIEVATIDQTNNEWQITTGQISAVDGDGLVFKTDDGNTRIAIQDDGDVAFDTDTLFVDAVNNRVGIGTSSPTHKIDIITNGGNQVRLYAADVSSTAQADIDFWYLDGGGSPYQNAQISAIASGNAGNGNLVFYTRPTSGSLTERMRIQANGGISFNGDTAAANALDDYEEGTFTPILSSGYSTGPTSYNEQVGAYTKVGNLVTIFIEIDPNGAVASSDPVEISGLPFTSYNSRQFGAASESYNNAFITSKVAWHIPQNDTLIRPYKTDGNAYSGNGSGVSINSQIILVGTYKVA